MQMKNPHKKVYGKPNGTIYVIFQEGLYGTPKRGRTVCISMYDTSIDEMVKFFKGKVKEEMHKRACKND